MSQEEEKGREEEVEVAELIEDQKAQGRDSYFFDILSFLQHDHFVQQCSTVIFLQGDQLSDHRGQPLANLFY